MPDQAESAEGARIERYSAEQVAYSAAILGREPSAGELRAHHGVPADGIWQAGHDDDEASLVTEEDGQ